MYSEHSMPCPIIYIKKKRFLGLERDVQYNDELPSPILPEQYFRSGGLLKGLCHEIPSVCASDSLG